MSVAASAVIHFWIHFWICASARHGVVYKPAQGDRGARRVFRTGRLDDGWIRNVVGEEENSLGVPECRTRSATSASQDGNAYE